MLKKIIIAVLMLASTLAHSQIVANVDALRIREIQENLANDKVLTIDSTGLVAWKNQDEITPDLSAYYTKDEIDALLENISYNDLLNAPTNLSDFNNDEGFITISDVPSYTGGDGIDITNNEVRIKQSVLDEINANTNKTLSDVTSEGNVTNTKIKGSEVFSNTMKEDYAQIKNVNDSGWGLLPLQSEMKIALTAKDGTTVLSSIDVSWLASGDLAITIDDTDPNNPELVFSQGGVEVARIPASTLLSGVARSANLSNYILQFKDGSGAVVYSVNLEPLFEDYFTKADADARYALRTRTITAGTGLTGGGNLTDNITLNFDTDWGDNRYGTKSFIEDAIDDIEIGGRNLLLNSDFSRGFNYYWDRMNNSPESNFEIVGTALKATFIEGRNTDFGKVGFIQMHDFSSTNSVVVSAMIKGEGDLRIRFGGTQNPVIHINNEIFKKFTHIIPKSSFGNGNLIFEVSSGELLFDRLKLEKGNKATDWTPAPEDQVSDWNETNPDSYSFLKNKPTDLATQTWTNSQLQNYYTKTESLDQFVTLNGVQTIAQTKTFTSSPVVPLATLDSHAARLSQITDYGLGTNKIVDDLDSDIGRIGYAAEATNNLSLPYGGVISTGGFSGSGFQIHGTYDGEATLRFRRKRNNTWYDWLEVWHDGNFTPSDYVQKVAGKGLSSNDFTNTLKSKLDGIEVGAQKNVATNLSTTTGASSIGLASSTGSSTTIVGATTSNAGVMTASDKAKLNGIATGATKNRADSQNANKVHSHTIAEITGLQTELDDKVDKEAGKGLSSNDFTNTLKSKLDGIESQATKNRPDSQNAGKTENNTFSGNNTFTSSPVVPNPTLDAHAVNKEYVDSRVKFARYRWTNPVKFEGIVNFPTEIFNYNLDTQRTNNNERIYVEEGYYNVNVTLEFEENGLNFVEIHMNAIRIASNTGGPDTGTTVSTGVIYIGASDYISVRVSTSQGAENLIAEISFEKIK